MELTASPGFVDRLIHGEAFSSGHTLVSCEKNFHRLASTVVVKETSELRDLM